MFDFLKLKQRRIDSMTEKETTPTISNEYSLPELKCLRCGGTWVPRKTTNPKCCPHCKSPYWNKPRKDLENK